MFSSWVFAHGHLRPCLFCKCYLEEGSWPVMLAISPTTEQNGTHAETFEASHTPNSPFWTPLLCTTFGHGPLKRLNPPLSVFPPIAHECALVLRLPWLRAMTTCTSWGNDISRPQGCASNVPSLHVSIYLWYQPVVSVLYSMRRNQASLESLIKT